MDVRFYDNEETNWENDMNIFDEQIKFIHVDEYEQNKLINAVDAPPINDVTLETTLESISQRNRIFISAYIEFWCAQDNTYALYLKSVIDADPIASNEILKQDAWEGVLRKGYPNNGLNIDDLLVWASQSSGEKVLLSDWDRTITVVEGMFFGPIDGMLTSKVESTEILLKDLLVYLMGGESRLEEVIQMFKALNDYGIPIYILTHNRNASKVNWPLNRKLYVMILNYLMPEKTEEEMERILFSSADYVKMKSIKEGDRENSYRKYKSTCSIDMLKDVLKKCKKYEMIIGGKRKRTKRRRTKRRRTKGRRTKRR